MSRVYFEHRNLLESNHLTNYQKKYYELILKERATESSIKSSCTKHNYILVCNYREAKCDKARCGKITETCRFRKTCRWQTRHLD